MDRYSLEPLLRSDIRACSALLARVFKGNPAYSSVFRTSEVEAGLRWLFERNLGLQQETGAIRVLRDRMTGELAGTFTLIPPNAPKISLLKMLRAGLPLMPLHFGRKSIQHLLQLKSTHDLEVQDVANGKSYWYLSMVAIQPSLQGQGLGSSVLRSCLKAPLPMILTTQLERNVRFYEKLGFRQDRQTEWRVGSRSFANWTLKRDL